MRIVRGAALLGSVLAIVWAVLLAFDRSTDQTPQPIGRTDEAVPDFRQTAGHRKMLSILKQLKDRTPDHHPFYGKHQPEILRQRLANLGSSASVHDRLKALYAVAIAELEYEPTPQRAIEHLLEANELLLQLPEPIESAFQNTKFLLATAYLRQGEIENCCLSSNADSCILPIQRGGVHARTEGSRQAIKYYLECLEHTRNQKQEDLLARYASIWLLNVAFMTLDEYPDRVPEEYLIPPEYFQSPVDFPRFENVMPKLDLATMDHAGGVIVDDFDNDDYLDIFICSAGPTIPTRFFRNNRDGTISDRSQEAGLTGLYGGLNMVQADFNNDGNLDVYIMRGAWMGEEGRHPDSLLRNNGNATFTDVTFEAGLGEVHNPNKTAAWGDYDNDGDLDLFVANEARTDSRVIVDRDISVHAPCQLFRNNGNSTFTDVAAAAGVCLNVFSMATLWGDFDGDRYPDLFVASGPSNLFRNNRDGTFTNVTESLGVRRTQSPFPSWFWDFDNDGALDLFISSTSMFIDRIALRALGEEAPSDKEGYVRLHPQGESPAGPFLEYEIPALYRGDGRGGFVEVAREQGLTSPAQPMGANFGDLNGDGFLDFYLTTGNVPYWDLWPNVMYLNQGGTGFANVTMDGGFGHLQKGHGVSFADIDNDGDQDVYSNRGGQFTGDKFTDALFENPGFGHHWITVKLVGERSNKSAIGARIHVTIQEDGKPRSIYRHVNSGGSFGCNPLRQNIGLGNAEKIVSIEIYWPTTDLTQTFHDVALDQSIEIHEGDDRVRTLDHVHSFKLGGP